MIMRATPQSSPLRKLLRRLVVSLGSAALTLAFFLVLPLLQAIARSTDADTTVRDVDTTQLPPPEEPEEEVEEPEEEPEEEPPELEEEAPPLDLEELSLALEPGFGGGFGMGRDFALRLNTLTSNRERVEELFSLSELDQRPRATFQPQPEQNLQTRKRSPGQVVVVFIVNERGQVETPRAQSCTDPVFEKPALDAVKKWKFEPGKKNGKPVRTRMRVTLTFPERG